MDALEQAILVRFSQEPGSDAYKVWQHRPSPWTLVSPCKFLNHVLINVHG
jgi:hypothetical protein